MVKDDIPNLSGQASHPHWSPFWIRRSSPHVAPASDYQHHWNTPSSELVDALGRTVETVRRNRASGEGDADPEAYRTRSTFDIRGNELTVTDPLGRKAFDYTYDLRDNRIRTESIDAGDEVTILDAAGNEVERRDGKGSLVLQAYDELDRPIRLWARDDETDPETPTLREYVVYGDSADGPSEDDARDRNLLGNRYRHYAQMRYDHADEVVEYLENKQFTGVELYDWMSGILKDVYSYFLQQATSMAKLAQNQLAFQRHETPPTFIQDNYWQSPSEGQLSLAEGDGEDRRGLTGSARLLRDITKLDQYAFETDERKLHLSKTISLAQYDPVAFQRFRETGTLTFDTPRELFERDYPGHYLRLIKSVRTSVVALVPPTQGITATLSTSGTSRTVAKRNGSFREQIIRRSPESVALTSPEETTGRFELQPKDGEMLSPFEFTGVDTRWEFQMPKPANRIDYDSIVDVQLTIEYTALESFDRRREVLQRLDPDVTLSRAFSFREEFVDQWFDLNNPDQTADPMTVHFETRREDFQPNLQDLSIRNLMLYFVRGDTATPVTGDQFDRSLETKLSFTEQGGRGTNSGEASPVDGVISTRQANAGGLLKMTGSRAVGEWTLTFPKAAARFYFENEEIEDILFVVTYDGRTPEWPE